MTAAAARPARPLLAELIAQPGRVLGTWTQFDDGQVIDLLGAAGYHFTIVDLEHGALGIEAAARLIRDAEAAGVVPLVRVPRGEAALGARLLDAGAAGVVAPGVESAAEAAAWVRALRFAPEGSRGACPIVRAAGHSLQAWSEVESAQSRAGLVALIESPAGIEACEAICRTGGVMAVMVGPFDLSVAMGLHGAATDPRIEAAVERVIAAAAAAGLPFWMPVFAAEPERMREGLERWAQRGVRHFVIGADKIIVAQALRRYREAAS